MRPDLPEGSAAPPALAERLETLAAWIGELDARVRAAELATGDEKTAKELRRAVEAIAKHDPKFHDKVQNHVDVLSDRVATLAGTVATATAAIAGKDGEIAGLRRDLDQANAHIGTLAASARGGSPAGELDDIRRALKELAAEREARAPDKRLANLEEKLELLTQRLDTVSGTVSTATASMAGRDGEVAALQRQLDEDGSRFGAAIAELRQTADPAALLELRSAVDALTRQSAALQQETRSKLVAFGVDVEGFGAQVGELGAALAGRDAEVVRLRDQVEQGGQSLATVTDGLRHATDERVRLAARLEEHGTALEELASAQSHERSEAAALAERFGSGSAKVEGLVRELQAALDTMPTGPDPKLTEQLDAVVERLDGLTSQVGSLTAADDTIRAAAAAEADAVQQLVADLGRRLTAHEQELEALAGRLESRSAEVTALVGELRAAVDGLPTGPDPALAARLDAQDDRLAAVAAEVERATTAGAGQQADLSELGGLVEALQARLLATEEGAKAFEARLESASAKVEARIGQLRESLDAVPRAPDAGLVEKIDAHDRRLAAFADELRSIGGAADEQQERTSHELAALRTELAATAGAADGVERLAGVVEELRARVAASELGAEGLAARLERGNAKVEALIHDLRQALETMPQGPDPALVEQLAGQAETIASLAGELDRIGAAVGSSSAASAAASERLDEHLGELAARVASSERGLAALASTDVAAQVEALAGRIDAIERKEAERANSLEPLAGEGRLQVQLQAVELRVEHAEAAARESRDAVLEQIERLASRIESRLQRLESEPEPDSYPPPAVTDGQVIAIRSGEA